MFTPGFEIQEGKTGRVIVLKVSSNLSNTKIRDSVLALQLTYPKLDILVVDDLGYVRRFSEPV